MTTYTGASVSGWSWGTTWTASDDANDDEEDGEDFRVRHILTVQKSMSPRTCPGIRYRKRLFDTASRLLRCNV